MKRKEITIVATVSALILIVLIVVAGVTIRNKASASRAADKTITESQTGNGASKIEIIETEEVSETAPTENMETETTEDVTQETETEAVAEATEEAEAYEEVVSDGEIVEYGPVVVLDGAAYERVGFKEDVALSYAETINEFANDLQGVAEVYDLLIPLGSGITFPDNRRDEINSSDQHATMELIFGALDDVVKKVDVYDALMSHRSEYIYFRTDHHWTARGAYYAYTKFCEAKGIEAAALDSYETDAFEGFLGTYYMDTKDKSLKEGKDTVEVFYPKSDTSFTVTPEEGDIFSWRVVNDVSTYKPGTKYSTFIAGDNPYSVIENKDVTDGTSCVVVKESFGNAFVPFLVDHYQTIYIVDYRYWEGSLEQLVKDTGAQDLIFANNLSMVSNKYLVGQLRKVK